MASVVTLLAKLGKGEATMAMAVMMGVMVMAVVRAESECLRPATLK